MSRWQQKKKLHGRINIQRTTDASCWLISPGLLGLQKISQILILSAWYERAEQSHWSSRELTDAMKGFSQQHWQSCLPVSSTRGKDHMASLLKETANKHWAILLRRNKYSAALALQTQRTPSFPYEKQVLHCLGLKKIRRSNIFANKSEALQSKCYNQCFSSGIQ